jgi:hypothetical protein
MFKIFNRKKELPRQKQAFTGNAEDLLPKQLQELFVPNFMSGDNEQLCTYDRVALPQRTYILVADRGVGKTHFLKLLRHTMEDRGDFVVWFSALSPLVLDVYPKLRREYQKDDPSILWQLAIFEAIGIELLSPTRQRSFLFWDSGASLLVEYFRKYHPAQLNNAIRYWQEQVEQAQTSGPLTEVMLSVEAFWAKITTDVKAGEPKDNEAEPPSAAIRKEIVETWVWTAIQRLQSIHYEYDEEESTNILIRKLPRVRSLYVIADGLDQDRPLKQEDLMDLLVAMKELNKISKDKLGPDEEKLNFKMIVALRAITYEFSIKNNPKFQALTHLRGNKEDLSWEDDRDVDDPEKDIALKRFIAKYILVHSNNNFTSKTLDQILELSFSTGSVVYFGHIFNSGVEFILEYTERRPREIIYLWQACASKAKSADQPYSVALSPHHLIAGLKEYTTEALIEDICAEYELEFPGINRLLNEFMEKRITITRILPKQNLQDIIDKYIESHEDEPLPFWLEEGKADRVIRYLFQMGILGIPTADSDIDDDWPIAIYARNRNDTDKSIDDSEYIVIRPAFWNYMTNIRTETKRRRQFIISIYQELQKLSQELGNQLSSSDLGFNLEVALARFISVAGLIGEFNKYPEHIDWDILQEVKQELKLVWDKFKNTPFFPKTNGDEKIILNVMSEKIRSIVIQKLPSLDDPDIVYTKLEDLKNKIEESPDYRILLRRAETWLFKRKIDKDTQRVNNFRDKLIFGEESFSKVLGRAIDTITRLK